MPQVQNGDRSTSNPSRKGRIREPNWALEKAVVAKKKSKASRSKAPKKPRKPVDEKAERRGFIAEDKFQEALDALADLFVLTYMRTKRYSRLDRRGIDFQIWGVGQFECYFTVDVTASDYTAKRKADDIDRHGYNDDHHVFVVEPADSHEKVLHHLIELFAFESGADVAELETLAGI